MGSGRNFFLPVLMVQHVMKTLSKSTKRGEVRCKSLGPFSSPIRTSDLLTEGSNTAKKRSDGQNEKSPPHPPALSPLHLPFDPILLFTKYND
ncbi:hypothetical protein CEXT_379641 [Caerostris extrusa]|uniref:Ycf15 n=1 Tax=Caerostris extrusa TaxID=172846 RepID=A0AAV4NS67_CAEEX|nr:hypothetical protein CEXT_379641 [Caerostris extrusa]